MSKPSFNNLGRLHVIVTKIDTMAFKFEKFCIVKYMKEVVGKGMPVCVYTV